MNVSKECKCILKSYSRHITHPCTEQLLPLCNSLCIVPIFNSLIITSTNTRSETEGVWTAVLSIMAFEGTAEHTKLLLFMERHSDLCLTTKTCATLMQNPHMYEVIEITVFLSVFHSQKCVSMHNVTLSLTH